VRRAETVCEERVKGIVSWGKQYRVEVDAMEYEWGATAGNEGYGIVAVEKKDGRPPPPLMVPISSPSLEICQCRNCCQRVARAIHVKSGTIEWGIHLRCK
jgi:hypothetical protein